MKIHLHFFIEEIMKKILLIAGSVFLLFFCGYYYHLQVGNSLFDTQKNCTAGSHYPVTIRIMTRREIQLNRYLQKNHSVLLLMS